MTGITRRTFLQLAAAIGASPAWGRPSGRDSRIQWHERRERYPEGVASGDPDSNSALLWTRHPYPTDHEEVLRVEVSEDNTFRKVVATASAPVSIESDWTCRVLVGGLKAGRVYWYRFTDQEGMGKQDRSNHHRSIAERHKAGVLCFCQLSKCESRRPERISPHDLRRRACR